MSLASPTFLTQFLEELGTKPKKGLSQNFLIDANIVRKILKSAQIEKGDFVVEIGPGPGVLTEALVGLGCTVIAIEKDHKFAESLKRLGVTVFEADILEFPLEKFLQEQLPPGKKAKILSNLPYNITTPVITLLLPLQHLISSLTFMVQKEVAERIVARVGKEYGSLSVFAQFYAEVAYAFTVAPTCFFPKPKVESAVVCFTTKKSPLAEQEEKDFFALTRAAFQKRRKMLRTSLKELFPHADFGSFAMLRPEQLSLRDFLVLFRTLTQNHPIGNTQ